VQPPELLNGITYVATMPDGRPPHQGEASPGYIMASVYLVLEANESDQPETEAGLSQF
jgi:hypothetical protein